MNEKSYALYEFLVSQATSFTDEWMKYQLVKKGSDYSADAPPQVAQRIREQNSNYVRLVAKTLIHSEDETKKAIEEWTNKTAADRVQSNTSLSEVVRNSGVFRHVYWMYVQKFVEQTTLDVNVSDIFGWERKINFALDYVLETFTNRFMEIVTERLAAQASLIRELSAPVITLTNQIGLLPLIGDIDTNRAKSILESTLHQSVHAKISVLIMDLSGVVMVDTMVAQQLFQLVDSLRMVGVKTILTGIRPEVAQTAIQLGINFGSIQTETSLQKVVGKLVMKHM
ncbi:STAS domain-containing protein [Priestia koreensis]|uniref:STAS domain-containing protein n=1 Tax=Priestia koreensis TaxID=284581 RepID=UPI0028F71CE1|nr:STAS domain-containing protein [Priestia koreensis]